MPPCLTVALLKKIIPILAVHYRSNEIPDFNYFLHRLPQRQSSSGILPERGLLAGKIQEQWFTLKGPV